MLSEVFLFLDFSVNSNQSFKVMTTLDLKKHLIQRISEINDTNFLKAIKTILDSKSTIISLSQAQLKEITQSQEEVSQGLFISQEELNIEFEKWAKTK